MCKSLGDYKSVVVIFAQHLRMPAQESGRALAKINSDVEYLTLEAGDEFHFGVRRILEVEAADGAPKGREAVVNLLDATTRNESPQFFRTKQSFEVATAIAEGLAVYHVQAGNWSGQDIKAVTQTESPDVVYS